MANQTKIDEYRLWPGFFIEIFLTTDRTNSRALIEALAQTPDGKKVAPEIAATAYKWCYEYIDLYYPGEGGIGAQGRGYCIWMDVDDLKDSHREHVGRPQPVEPSDTRRDVAWNGYTKQWETVFPESEFTDGVQIIEQFYHAPSGQWMTVPA